ncbi:MAG: ABC transporter substrate-binding protein [Rubrobacteraceae bacterium]
MRTSLKALVILVALSFVAAACGGGEQSGGSQAETITIGSLHPTSGPLAVDGKRMDEAVKMAVEDINKDGGIESMDGAQLEVAASDTQGEAEVGSREAQRLIDDGAVAIVGPFQSAVAATVARTTERSQVPFVIDVAAAESILDQGYTFTFRIQPDSAGMGEFGARYLKDIAEATNTPVETFAYVHENSEYGTSVSRAFIEEAEKEGIEVTDNISYDALNVSDLTSEVTQAASSNPDVIVVTGYYGDSLLFAEAASNVKPDVKGIYGVANGAYSLEQFPEDAGDQGQNYFDSNYHFDATSDRVNDLRSRFQERTGQGMRTPAVFSYQAVELIAEALEQSGSADPTELRDAIADISMETELFPFDGPIEFNDKGQNMSAQPIVMQVQEDKITQVYPEEFAQAQPKFPAVPWSK